MRRDERATPHPGKPDFLVSFWLAFVLETMVNARSGDGAGHDFVSGTGHLRKHEPGIILAANSKGYPTWGLLPEAAVRPG